MLAVSQPHWACPSSRSVCPPCSHCSGSGLPCQERSEAGPGLYAPPRFKPLRFRHSGTPQKHRLGWACVLCPSQVMAPHSSTLAWKIPWTEEPGRLQTIGSRRVGHDWVTSLWLLTFMHWRRKWQSLPVFLPGESQGQRSLVGCHLWGHTESDTTEAT